MSLPSPATVLITGAAQRIGRKIALFMAKEGWDVAIHYHRSHESAETLAEEIRQLGCNVYVCPADLTEEDAVEALIPKLTSQIVRPLTCLINNAALFANDRLATTTRRSWDGHMAVNLRAPFLLMQQFAAALPKDIKGNIINMIDYAVWHLPQDKFLSYTISKSSLWTLTQMLANSLAPRIRVNAIGPGPALANERQTPEQFAKSCASTPLGTGTNAEEICQTIAFLLSTSSITGQMIALDGGKHLITGEYI